MSIARRIARLEKQLINFMPKGMSEEETKIAKKKLLKRILYLVEVEGISKERLTAIRSRDKCDPVKNLFERLGVR